MKKILLLILTVAMLVCAVPHMAFAADPNTIEVEGLKYELNSDGPQKTATLTDGTSARYDVTIPATVSDGGTNYSVTTIGDDAFSYCKDLTSVTIGNRVKTIGKDVFSGCSSLTSINVDNDNDYFKVEDNVLFSKNGEELVLCPSANRTGYTIPNSVTTIGERAFSSCYYLKSVTIPVSVTAIGDNAFCWCSDLTSVTIGKGVKTIGSSAFDHCRRLTSINVDANNKNFKSKDNVLFDKDCTKLILCPEGKTGAYNVPNSVTAIGDDAFRGCENLTSITIPDSVTTIGDHALAWCESLMSITIGKGVKTFGKLVFYCCDGLTSINLDNNNNYFKVEDNVLFSKNDKELVLCSRDKRGDYNVPDSVTTIGDSAFCSCVNLTSITISDNVKSIGEGAFSGCENLTSVTIPDSVTTIGIGAFFECLLLNTVTIGKGVETIGEIAFSECRELESITVPDNVKSIGNCAFLGCTWLKTVTIGKGVKTIGEGAFSECRHLESITIPSDFDKNKFEGTLIDVCENDNNTFTNYFYKLGHFNYIFNEDNLTYKLNSKSKKAELIDGKGKKGAVNIPATVSYDGTNYSVTTIGEEAFQWCGSLKSVTIPRGVTTIGKGAFSVCCDLKSITIPSDFNIRKKFKGTSITVVNNNTFTNPNGDLGRFVLPND